MYIIHQEHRGLFEGPEPAQWIRTMDAELAAYIFRDTDYSPQAMVELAVALVAEQGASAALFGVGIHVDFEEEDLEKVPVAVYYYTMADAGRTCLDKIMSEPTRAAEELVDIPEWFPCLSPSGSKP